MKGLENLILTELIEKKRVRGKQLVTYLLSLSKLMTEKGWRNNIKTKH